MHFIPREHLFSVEFASLQESLEARPLRADVQLLFHRFLDAGVGYEDDTFPRFSVVNSKGCKRLQKRAKKCWVHEDNTGTGIGDLVGELRRLVCGVRQCCFNTCSSKAKQSDRESKAIGTACTQACVQRSLQ